MKESKQTTYTFVAVVYSFGVYDYTTVLHVRASSFGAAERIARKDAERTLEPFQRVIIDTAQVVEVNP